MAAPGGQSREVKFAPVLVPPPPTVKNLEGYFDNVAGAATNKKAVFDQLVTNNTKLTATNAEMAEAVKQLQAAVCLLRQEVSGLKHLLGSGRGHEGGRGGDMGTGGGRPKNIVPKLQERGV